ncbi:MAG: PD-(D/E)XK nuclease family protein [Candidatus Magasanikbacteria bacterium]
MGKDKFTAVWVSHSSITDFLQCPRSYYLKNIYRDPRTNHKIKIMNPSLALGQIVHEVLESLSVLPTTERFRESLIDRFEKAWKKVSGIQGGFISEEQENKFKERGKEMLRRVVNNPGPLEKLALKIQQDLPSYWLSEEENIILCGKVDWLEYLQEIDSVHIIDFKTGKNKEDKESLQLPIYNLLVSNCQKRKVVKASYWYLETDNFPTEKVLPNLEEAYEKVFSIAKQVKLARQIQRFKCPHGEGGCFACSSLEKIVRGEGKLIGIDEYKADVYILEGQEGLEDAVIL